MNIRRSRLQRQIILLMTMRAPHRIQVLPLNLLVRERRPRVASSEEKGQPNRQQDCRANCLTYTPSSLMISQFR
jgi:hypothetical protein